MKVCSKSGPRPNGVPYIIYKRCPRVMKKLWLYLKTMWEDNVMTHRGRQNVF